MSNTRPGTPPTGRPDVEASADSAAGALPAQPAGALIFRSLLDRLAEPGDTSVIAVTAPAGYGKTTLLRQWADVAGRSAYLRLSMIDNDPAVLIRRVADAIRTVAPIGDDVSRSITTSAADPGLQAAARLATAISAPARPAVLMLDDAHIIHDQRAVDALALLGDRMPDWLTLGLAGRDIAAFPLGRVRAGGRLREFGIEDLAFDVAQTRQLAQSRGLALSEDEAGKLVAETEGWPVALYLAMLAYADADAHGRDRSEIDATQPLADYLRSELLAPLDGDLRSWLYRSAALESMTGPLCDAALQETGSLARLRELERSNALITAVDIQRTAYRYHPLLRDVLLEELEIEMPGIAREIAARAATWHQEHGEPMLAVEYAHESGDHELLGRLMARNIWPIAWSGRIATLERWITWFDADAVRERYAWIAVLIGFHFALDGRRHEAELWLAAAEHSDDPGPMPDGTPTRAPWVALLRGMLMPAGMEQLKADVVTANETMRPDSPFMPATRVFAAVGSMLDGSPELALTRAREARELTEARGAMPGFAIVIGEEAALAVRVGTAQDAKRLVDHGLERLGAVGMDGNVATGLVHAVAARVAVTNGSTEAARRHLGYVNRMRPKLTSAAPWFSVQVRLEAIRACMALSDLASARALMLEVEDIFAVRPDLGSLGAETSEIRKRLDASFESGAGLWTLTSAELRVLSFLPTHLTFREIADRLFVSQHTVKTQAVAIYSKLGVSSRRTAIETAVENGLLDASALRFPVGTHDTIGIG